MRRGHKLAALLVCVAAVPAARAERPLLVTVDDLPLQAMRLHPRAADRERITRDMLAVLKKHRVPAVGLVVADKARDPINLALLGLWLDAGHELGNHSYGHLNYTATDVDDYVADVERGRKLLEAVLAARGKTVRFFRFPFLREGDTSAKLEAMRAYLTQSGQRNLPVTIDNQDWSFEEPWVRARSAGDSASLATIAADYQAALRVHVRHHTESGDRLLGRVTPQILLLHAGEVGAAQWDALFTWLAKTGHRFATADEVLADPALGLGQGFVGRFGFSLWDRFAAIRRREVAIQEVKQLLADRTEAWNRGDLAGFAAAYDADARIALPDGAGVTTGRDAAIERLRRRHPEASAMGVLALDVLDVQALDGDEVSYFGDAVPGGVHAVTIHARWTLLPRAGAEPVSGSSLLVLRRRGSTWAIIHDATM